MNIDGETYNSEGVECPYCGHVDKDSWELEGEDGDENETECENCEKSIIYERNISISYTGKKKEK